MRIWGINVRCAASAEEAFAIIDDEHYAVRRAVRRQRLRSGESGFEHPESAI